MYIEETWAGPLECRGEGVLVEVQVGLWETAEEGSSLLPCLARLVSGGVSV